jgi:hypothetical protein
MANKLIQSDIYEISSVLVMLYYQIFREGKKELSHEQDSEIQNMVCRAKN